MNCRLYVFKSYQVLYIFIKCIDNNIEIENKQYLFTFLRENVKIDVSAAFLFSSK